MSNELLQKVISTSSIGADPTHLGGLLTPAQAGQFIDYMWDATVLGSQVRTVPMNSESVELDRISVGERLLRVATEAVDDGVNPAVAFTKVSLTTTKFRLDWELSSEALEDGLEGDALEDHIARLMAQQVSNDLEDLAINGDSLGHEGDALLKGFDGWRKRLYYGGSVLDGKTIKQPDGTTPGTLTRGVFNAALRAMPRKFNNNRNALRFFTATGLIQDYLYTTQFAENMQGGYAGPVGTTGANANTNPSGAAGWQPAAPYGVPLAEVPLFPQYTAASHAGGGDLGTIAAGDASDVWLVDPKNLIWGVVRAIEVYREFKPKKDTIEYTLYTRVGCTVENPQASVVVKDVKFAQ